MAFEHAGGILAMIIAIFVGLLLVLVMATVLGMVGGILVEGVFIVLAVAVIVAGVLRYTRR
jgi:hypothetical protein